MYFFTNIADNVLESSNIREVPDHQEIYLDTSGFSSVIVEIAERVSDPPTDQEALKFHFEDIVDEHDASRVWHTDVAQLVHLPYVYPFPSYPFDSIDAHAHSLISCSNQLSDFVDLKAGPG